MKSSLRSPLLPIFLIVAVDVLGLTLILPLLPFYAEHFGASPAVVGTLVTTYALCQLIAGPILGQISDRVGRRPVLLVSQLGTFVGFLILAFSNSLWLVFLSRVIDGLTAGNLSIAQAYIADVSQPKDRAKSFAVIGISFGLGFLIGPAISGYLSQFGIRYPIFAAAGLSFASILATYFLLPRGKPAHAHEGKVGLLQWGKYRRYFRDPEVGPLLLQFFAFAFAFATFTSGFALFAERRYSLHGAPFGPKQVGYVFAFAGFMGILWQTRIGRLVKRFGERRLVTAGFSAMALGYGLLGFTARLPSLLGVTAISSFGNSALRPCLTSLITQSVSPREQGLILGLNQSLLSVAQITAPLLAGFLIGHGELTPWALVACLAAGIGMLLPFTLRPETQGTDLKA